MPTTDLAIRAEGLVKTYGRPKADGSGVTRALDGLDLTIASGTVLGVLGPNGAGKTTAVRILSTLLRPDAGIAIVAGYDVTRHPREVRSVIGLTGQYAAIDENLTGRENLVMIGRLAQLGAAVAKTRADELLERFGLVAASARVAKTYSGGMRRRLDLAASLVARPVVLFLDEPTTGLDPRSRSSLWEVIRSLVDEGTTLLLTTQYLEEADVLADDIAVIDGGRVIARGTATELKERVGGEVLALVPDLAAGATPDAVLAALGSLGTGARIDRGTVTVPVGADRGVLTAIPRRLDEAGVALSDIGVRRPSLDDVFLALTGHGAEEGLDVEGDDAQPTRARGRGGRSRRAARKGATA